MRHRLPSLAPVGPNELGKFLKSPTSLPLLSHISDELNDANADQENVPHVDLPKPNKRTKASTTTATTKTTTKTTTAAAAAKTKTTAAATKARATSKATIQASQVLSPKSHNSRTLPQSPIRPVAPFISQPNVARAVSTATTGTAATKSRATRAKAVGTTAASTTTTKKTAVAAAMTTTAKKRVTKPKAEAAPTAPRRVLRKRP